LDVLAAVVYVADVEEGRRGVWERACRRIGSIRVV